MEQTDCSHIANVPWSNYCDGTAMPGVLADSDQSGDTDSDSQCSSPSLEHAFPTFQSGKLGNIQMSMAFVRASNQYVPSLTNFKMTKHPDASAMVVRSTEPVTTGSAMQHSNPYVPSLMNFKVTKHPDVSAMAVRNRLQSTVTPVTKKATQLGMKPGTQNHEVSKHEREGKQETPSTSHKRRKVWEIPKEEWDVYFHPTGWIRPDPHWSCQDLGGKNYLKISRSTQMTTNISVVRIFVIWDYANPQTAHLLQHYPEDTKGPVSEIWQATQWKELPPDLLTPMCQHKMKDYYVNELAETRTGEYVIPYMSVIREGALCCDAHRATVTPNGLLVEHDLVNICVEDLEWNYLDLRSEGPIMFAGESQTFLERMPNPLHAITKGEELYTSFVFLWADDVRGNTSKLISAHKNIYLAHTNLPGQLLQQEYFVRFISTSPEATTPEQFEAVKEVILETQQCPLRVFHAHTRRMCKFRLVLPGLPADNPQQLEEASHIRPSGNCKCQRCFVGGPPGVRESDEGYHALHEPGVPRTVAHFLAEICQQLDKAMDGSLAPISGMQMAPALRIGPRGGPRFYSTAPPLTGLDPHRDTPVEILHTVLLGLGAVLWYHSIPDMKEYLGDLCILIANVLDVFDLVDPARILEKGKLHILTHLVEDVERFSPAIWYTTEVFECFNHVFWMCSVLSNHQSPGHDIAHKCASLERVKNILSGTFWLTKDGQWTQAAPQTHLGWAPPPTWHPGQMTPGPKSTRVLCPWSDIYNNSDTVLFSMPPQGSTWYDATSVRAQSGGLCQSGMWVCVEGNTKETLLLGRITHLLLPQERISHGCVILDRFNIQTVCILTTRCRFSQDLNMNKPHRLTSWQHVKFQFNAQHDCHSGECILSECQFRHQEHEVTEHTVPVLVHADDAHFIINLHALHNASILREILPRHLTAPTPLHVDSKAFHYEMATKLRVTQEQKHKNSAANSKATRIVNKLKKQMAQMERIADTSIGTDAVETDGVLEAIPEETGLIRMLTAPPMRMPNPMERIACKMREQAERDSATDVIDPNLPSTFEALRAALTPAPSLNERTHEEPSEDEEDDDDPYADLHSSDLPTQLILTATWLLKTDIKKYTHCIILSPFLTSCQSSVPAKSVMAAMWELSISSLPREKEAHKMKVVISAIGTQLTNLPTPAISSRQRCCAPLTMTVLQPNTTSPLYATASLPNPKPASRYARPHAHGTPALDHHQSVSPDKTWSSVDSEMRDLESQSTSKEERARHLKAILELDIADHPRPADEHVQYPTTATKDLEEWQKICDRHPGKVEVEIKWVGHSRQ
ncbi:hypothetical protein JB92DRAFT_2830448 [Gautieria morchelliformis]|nr:hypothetical protein JB92DRAFT_2830448 [Gautieria morchelliformis]